MPLVSVTLRVWKTGAPVVTAVVKQQQEHFRKRTSVINTENFHEGSRAFGQGLKRQALAMVWKTPETDEQAVRSWSARVTS